MSRAEREAQLLRIAEEVFTELGYQATTMDDIAARAGITKPVIYDHFGSKEKLLNAVVSRSREELLAGLNEAWDNMPEDAHTSDYFRAGVRAFFDFVAVHKESFALIRAETDAHGEIEVMRRTQAGNIATRLAKIRGLEHLHAFVLEATAEILIAVNEHMAMWWLRHQELPMDAAVDITTQLLWKGFNAFREVPAAQ